MTHVVWFSMKEKESLKKRGCEKENEGGRGESLARGKEKKKGPAPIFLGAVVVHDLENSAFGGFGFGWLGGEKGKGEGGWIIRGGKQKIGEWRGWIDGAIFWGGGFILTSRVDME